MGGGVAIALTAFWIAVGITNVLAIIGMNDMIHPLLQVKMVVFALSILLLIVEFALLDASHILLGYLFGFALIAQIIITPCAIKDTLNIYKWIKYYKGGGPK